MNLSTGLDRLTYKRVFTDSQADWLFSQLEKLEPAYWVHRTEMHGGRTLAQTECSYRCCLNRAIPTEIREFLKTNNPLPTETLRELVINQYYPGDYIPLHRDRHMYRKFVLVPVQSSGDGVTVEGVFFEDVKGLGFIFDGTGHKHEVVPVQQKRYTVLYLYE